MEINSETPQSQSKDLHPHVEKTSSRRHSTVGMSTTGITANKLYVQLERNVLGTLAVALVLLGTVDVVRKHVSTQGRSPPTHYLHAAVLGLEAVLLGLHFMFRTKHSLVACLLGFLQATMSFEIETNLSGLSLPCMCFVPLVCLLVRDAKKAKLYLVANLLQYVGVTILLALAPGALSTTSDSYDVIDAFQGFIMGSFISCTVYWVLRWSNHNEEAEKRCPIGIGKTICHSSKLYSAANAAVPTTSLFSSKGVSTDFDPTMYTKSCTPVAINNAVSTSSSAPTPTAEGRLVRNMLSRSIPSAICNTSVVDPQQLWAPIILPTNSESGNHSTSTVEVVPEVKSSSPVNSPLPVQEEDHDHCVDMLEMPAIIWMPLQVIEDEDSP